MKNPALQVFERRLCEPVCIPPVETDIALSAIMVVLLSEVTQQHAATACMFGDDILFHRADAGFVSFFPFFIYGRRNMHVPQFHPFAGVYYIWCLFAGDIVYDTSPGEHDQYVVHLL